MNLICLTNAFECCCRAISSFFPQICIVRTFGFKEFIIPYTGICGIRSIIIYHESPLRNSHKKNIQLDRQIIHLWIFRNEWEINSIPFRITIFQLSLLLKTITPAVHCQYISVNVVQNGCV